MMTVEQLMEMREELTADGIMRLFNTLDFTPRWNLGDTIGFSCLCAFMLFMVGAAFLGY